MQGHTARVLHMAQSPDGTTVVSAGADETLRFWKCFAEAPTAQKVRRRSQVVPIPTRNDARCYNCDQLRKLVIDVGQCHLVTPVMCRDVLTSRQHSDRGLMCAAQKVATGSSSALRSINIR